jgi:IS1 family transposase
VIPADRHRASGRKRDTNHAERFFCTLRQRCARLVRKALSFSKRFDRHRGAIKFFVANYNLSLLL